MRAVLVKLHRWFGLSAGIFLFVAGLTGAVISWDHELDEWLNPQLFHAQATGQPLPVLELARRLEAADPRLQIRYLPLEIEPGHSLGLFVDARINPATGKPWPLDFNQIAIDPVNGEVLGKRMWGAISLSKENLLPFLYKLHYSMHIPAGWGMEWGILLMGILAIGWVIDCFGALILSFPNPASWRKSLVFRWKEGGYRLIFDLHRSGGVWLWLLLLMLAVTSISMNLQREVMRPLVGVFSKLTPSPQDMRPLVTTASAAPLSREQILVQAKAQALQRGWSQAAGGLVHMPEYGLYGVGFFSAGNSHGDGGLGNPWLYFDSHTGQAAGETIPGTGTAGDIFLQAMFPLHSGRIAGLPGRIAISLLGLTVAVFSATGLLIWLKKRQARLRSAAKQGRKK